MSIRVSFTPVRAGPGHQLGRAGPSGGVGVKSCRVQGPVSSPTFIWVGSTHGGGGRSLHHVHFLVYMQLLHVSNLLIVPPHTHTPISTYTLDVFVWRFVISRNPSRDQRGSVTVPTIIQRRCPTSQARRRPAGATEPPLKDL